MPSDSKAKSPKLNYQITFTEDDHSYVDNFGHHYMSVTTLISYAFERFDSEKIAYQCAKKRGCSPQSLIDQWAAKGNQANRLGTRLHENIENYINENYFLHTPENQEEKIQFQLAQKIINNIRTTYHPQLMQPEKLVFSPAFMLAGSVDLLVKIDDMNYIIFDWKRLNKPVSKIGFNNKCGIILPTFNIQDSNYWHYALQLQIYENILKSQQYVNPKASFKKALVVFTERKIIIEKINYVPEAWALMLWKNKINN